jgi:hypothetical protein
MPGKIKRKSMMKPFNPKRWSFALQSMACFLVLSACIFTNSISQTSGTPATPGAGVEATPGIPAGSSAEATGEPGQFIMEFGPGPFNLEDPSAGLAALSSYTATLKISFDGTWAGQLGQWSQTYVMLVSQEPAARQLTVEATGGDPAPAYLAEVNGVNYALDADNNCSTSPAGSGTSLASTWEPAGFLSGVIGADAAGSETVNDVAVDKYTFDERALGEAGFTHASGQVWVASDNGYVVRYLLTTTAKADYFGEGTDGTLTREYNLTGINQPVTISLPAACGTVSGVPVMADARNLLRQPGVTLYTTASSIADVLAFYQAQMPALGWTASDEPSQSDTTATMVFVQGAQKLSLLVVASAGGVEVSLAEGTTLYPGAP